GLCRHFLIVTHGKLSGSEQHKCLILNKLPHKLLPVLGFRLLLTELDLRATAGPREATWLTVYRPAAEDEGPPRPCRTERSHSPDGFSASSRRRGTSAPPPDREKPLG